MQIPINKDIRRYQEEIFMGLTLRQLLCSGIAIGLAVLIYLWAKPLLGQETASWLCILAAAPIAAAGFLSYDGLPFEKFVIIVLESTILCSGWRVWKTECGAAQVSDSIHQQTECHRCPQPSAAGAGQPSGGAFQSGLYNQTYDKQ